MKLEIIEGKVSTGSICAFAMIDSTDPDPAYIAPLIYYNSSSNCCYDGDFTEYDFKYKVDKGKFRSESILNYVVEEMRGLIGYNASDLQVAENSMLATKFQNEAIDKTVSYFGTFSIGDQTIFIIDIPEGKNEVYFYDIMLEPNKIRDDFYMPSEPPRYCMKLGDMTEEERKCRNVVVIMSSLVEDNKNVLNLSYKCWKLSTNPARFKHDLDLRNDEFFSVPVYGPKIYADSPGESLVDKRSGNLISITTSKTSDSTLAEKVISPRMKLEGVLYVNDKNHSGIIYPWNSGKEYYSGDRCFIYNDDLAGVKDKGGIIIYNVSAAIHPPLYAEGYPTCSRDWNREFNPPKYDLVYSWSKHANYLLGDKCLYNSVIWVSVKEGNSGNLPGFSGAWANIDSIEKKDNYYSTIGLYSYEYILGQTPHYDTLTFVTDDLKKTVYDISFPLNASTAEFHFRLNPGYMPDDRGVIEEDGVSYYPNMISLNFGEFIDPDLEYYKNWEYKVSYDPHTEYIDRKIILKNLDDIKSTSFNYQIKYLERLIVNTKKFTSTIYPEVAILGSDGNLIVDQIYGTPDRFQNTITFNISSLKVFRISDYFKYWGDVVLIPTDSTARPVSISQPFHGVYDVNTSETRSDKVELKNGLLEVVEARCEAELIEVYQDVSNYLQINQEKDGEVNLVGYVPESKDIYYYITLQMRKFKITTVANMTEGIEFSTNVTDLSNSVSTPTEIKFRLKEGYRFADNPDSSSSLLIYGMMGEHPSTPKVQGSGKMTASQLEDLTVGGQAHSVSVVLTDERGRTVINERTQGIMVVSRTAEDEYSVSFGYDEKNPFDSMLYVNVEKI